MGAVTMKRRLVLLSGLLTAGVLIMIMWLLTDRSQTDQDTMSDQQPQALESADAHMAQGVTTVQAPPAETPKTRTAPQPATPSSAPAPSANASQAIGEQTPASPHKLPKVISFGRCKTRPGYLMAKDDQIMAKAILLQSRRDLAGLKELQAAGLILELPARIEICLYDVNSEGSLAKILLPGQEIIYWTSYAALECNL